MSWACSEAVSTAALGPPLGFDHLAAYELLDLRVATEASKIAPSILCTGTEVPDGFRREKSPEEPEAGANAPH